MTNKRFKFVKPLGFTNLLKKDVFIKDRENDYYIRFVEEVVDLLNEQAERIKLLEDDILAQTMTINNLEGVLKVAQKENEKLKLKLKKYEDAEFERTQARCW